MDSMLRIRCAAAFAVIAALLLAGAAELSAQRFQWVYGGPQCDEAGRAGVTQLRNGGYVAVGETYSTGAPCGPSHIYVVYTAANGAPVWTNYYTIGTSDSALDVVECCNGDLAICGVSTNPRGCGFSRDAFVLRLNNAGGVVAVRTYGLPNSDEIAWNLVEAKNGDNINTRAGDLIVAGSTTNLQLPGIRDGFIMRVTNALGLIWNQQYGGPNDDYLYGVFETRVNPIAIVVPPGATDIVATGGTNSWGAGGYDTWVLRVNGNTGAIGLPPQNSATYGGPLDDEGRAIIELRQGNNPGDLVITGISKSRPGTGGVDEVEMLQTGTDPCVFVADQYAGDAMMHRDGGLDLKEDAFPASAGGNVIVTGYTDWGNAVVAPLNAFLQRFACGTMAPVGGGMAYGGTGEDWGWSVDVCRRDLFCTDETEGYVVAGFTKSPNLIGALDPSQLYLIKTDVTLTSGCNEVAFNFLAQPALFIRGCNPSPWQQFMVSCIPQVMTTVTPWGTQLCYAFPQTRQGDGGDIGAAPAPATIPMFEGGVRSYPNPLAVGTPLQLRFDVAHNADADVVVTDMAGHVVYRERVAATAGAALHAVPTAGWSAGAYVVRLEIDGHARTTKFVLSE